MTIPADYPLVKAQHLQHKASSEVVWVCNCPGQPATRTLRYVAAHRDEFNVWPPAAKEASK